MTSTEAPVADVIDVGPMRAESKRRIDAMNAAAKPAVVPVAATPAAVGKPEGDAPIADKVEGTPATGTVPATPTPVATEDLSEFPEEFRSPEKQATPEFRAWVKKEFTARGLRQADYTKKTTEVADERKKIEAAKARLDFAESVLSDKALLDVIDAEMARRESSKAEAFDYTTATPAEIKAHEAEIEERAASKALATIDARESKKTEVTSAFREMATAAKVEFVDSGEYTIEQVDAVAQKMGGMGVVLTKENVVEALRLALPKREAKPKDNPATNGAAARTAVGASVLTRKSGTTPVLQTPAWVREGRQPANSAERLQETLIRLNAKRGAAGLTPFTAD